MEKIGWQRLNVMLEVKYLAETPRAASGLRELV